jgi:hypothetical protein
MNRTVALSIGFAMICFGAALFFFTQSFLPVLFFTASGFVLMGYMFYLLTPQRK